jgi:hypothetical protein
VEERAPRVVEPVRLPGESAPVVLVVGEDVEHRPPLIAQLAVRHVQVAHDVEQRAAALLRLPHAQLELLDLRAQLRRLRGGLAVAGRIRHPGFHCSL